MIEWNKDFELGIFAIDSQHQKWVSIINRLAGAGPAKANRAQIIVTQLEQILNYADYHFGYEEELFTVHGYPETSEHRELHHAFAVRMLKHQQDTINGSIPMTSVLLTEMFEWLKHHICVEDKKAAEFLKAKGIT